MIKKFGTLLFPGGFWSDFTESRQRYGSDLPARVMISIALRFVGTVFLILFVVVIAGLPVAFNISDAPYFKFVGMAFSTAYAYLSVTLVVTIFIALTFLKSISATIFPGKSIGVMEIILLMAAWSGSGAVVSFLVGIFFSSLVWSGVVSASLFEGEQWGYISWADLSYNAAWGGGLGFILGSIHSLSATLIKLNNKIVAIFLPAVSFAITAWALSRVGFTPRFNFSNYLSESAKLADDKTEWGVCEGSLANGANMDKCMEYMLNHPSEFMGLMEQNEGEGFVSFLPPDGVYMVISTILILAASTVLLVHQYRISKNDMGR